MNIECLLFSTMAALRVLNKSKSVFNIELQQLQSRQLLSFTSMCSLTVPRKKRTICYSSFCQGSRRNVIQSKSESEMSHVLRSWYPQTNTRVRFMTTVSDQELRRSIENITDKFMEARELLDDAKTSIGTVYSKDETQEAREAVKETLSDYSKLLEAIDSDQEQQVRRTIGLKMEELKAQLANIEELFKQ